MSYCINPNCSQPQNPDNAPKCLACGSTLLLRDRYQIVQPLGQGGFGATFLAKDLSLPGHPICVIKELRPSTTDTSILQMARQLFEREAETLGKVGHHPQVPRLLGYFESNQQFYLVQEYVSGSTLKQEVKQYGALGEETVKQFLTEILPVVQYIHQQKVIHRDIKPANILRRSQDGHLVLIDFGAVKDKVNQTTTMMEGTGQTAFTNISIGTSGFAPPEQIALRPVYASDVYAVGVTCIYLLTAKSPSALGYDNATGEMLWRPNVKVSSSFAEILEKMLEVSVRDRYQSAEEVMNALLLEQPGDTDDGLADCMTVFTPETQLKTQFKDETPTVFEGEGISEFSPMSKIAQNIRDRKTRLGQTGATPQKQQQKRTKAQAYATRQQSGNSINTRDRGNTGFSSPNSSKKTSAKWNPNRLRSAYIKGERDFGDCDLSGIKLPKAQLAGANFYGANLHEINLEGANLSGANFGHGNLTGAILKEANLTKAYFSTASLENADLRGADLTDAYLNGANLRGANLCGANLSNARVSDSQLETAKTNWRTIKPDGKRGFGL